MHAAEEALVDAGLLGGPGEQEVRFYEGAQVVGWPESGDEHRHAVLEHNVLHERAARRAREGGRR